MRLLALVVALLAAGLPPPLWRLEDVAELSELLHRAEGRDRAGFLDVLAQADPDAADDPSPAPPDDEDEDDEDSTTAASSSSEDASTGRGGHVQRPPRRPPVLRRPVVGPVVPIPRAAVPGISPLPGLLEDEAATDDEDDIKWFNAQAFMKWLVKSLAALYEGLVKLMLLPLHMVISIIDV
ncbi:hypothetical protein GNI_026680 [Gregarina niphandrodes]|uniref:Transmembrane protein n=1 Tax=Gregarina niphandrodes TaxID=110365 RepID=A0A023BBK4_GRENI|nr:hypothetical protein GNI_026680 [Gregarina niphandrodes]EZG79385.1 hypothetical protein GNI_026680 [Gregarina niphandrodes]|eukprot:XP_011129055.1 hypothetical protein GNI_026680 [Gregarina niphandrodes]